MTLELLYFNDCPNHQQLLERLPQLLKRSGLQPELALRRIESTEEAQRERFLGSPTVRVDGHDIEPQAERRTDYGMKCRLYRTTAGLSGQPEGEWLLEALRRSETAGA
jgi:hypothetical protein